MTDRALSILIHAHSKVGKSTLSVTAPYPRLYLDVESASRFLPIHRKVWNPLTDPPPVPDGTWDTAVVYVRDYETVLRVYQWLNQTPHYFKSLIIDSISELQIRLQERIAGREQMQQQQWGEMLRAFAGLLRDMRDLTMHETNPLEALVLTAMSINNDGVWSPYLQGQVKTQAPYLFDVVGYLYVEQVQPENPELPPVEMRRLLTRKHPNYEAGERVQSRLPMVIDNPNIEQMLETVFPTVQPVAAPVEVVETAPVEPTYEAEQAPVYYEAEQAPVYYEAPAQEETYQVNDTEGTTNAV